MKNPYDIENLIETFKLHSEKTKVSRRITLEKNPDAEWAKEDFSISEALLAICEEIKQLKQDMNYGKTYQRFPK